MGETSHRPAVALTLAARKLRHDPLWWMISVLPLVLFAWLTAGEEGSPASVVGWLVVALYVLVVSALVAVVLVGVRQGWRQLRSDAGTDLDRAARRARSAVVAQTLVGSATLLLIVVVAVLLVLSAW